MAPRTGHLPADSGAGTSGSAAASTALCCDREGGLVLTAAGIGRRLSLSVLSPRRARSARPIPTAEGCARARRMECVLGPRAEPAGLAGSSGRASARASALPSAIRGRLGSLDIRKASENATKLRGRTGRGPGEETLLCKAKQFERKGTLSINVKTFGMAEYSFAPSGVHCRLSCQALEVRGLPGPWS